jgi:threonylcarbamoyladenosine tRNA methylthiotransferase MtaB
LKAEKKVSFYTLGCKLNFAETSTIARKFSDNGYLRVEFKEPANVVVINTCSVTQLADKKCRQVISKAKRTSPDAIIAVVGCYSQLKPNEIAALSGVDLVLGTNEKFNIIKYLEEYEDKQQSTPLIYSCEIEQINSFNSSFSLFDRTRSFLKVQDGCDFHCSYCTVPLARGKSRNPGIAQVLAQAQEISKQDIKEVVLTGVNLADFGHSTGETFLELIQQLDKIEGINRFRISSIEPNLLTDEIIQFIATSKRFAPHFHIPLQSGCNDILGLMGRRYKRELLANKVHEIKALMPDACIGNDVIVGFPGETDDLYNDTFCFLKDMNISYLHVFTYSERPNTRAVNFSGKVLTRDKENRSRMLIELSEQKRATFYEQNLGKEYSVLFESQQSKGQMFGFTPNYIKVETKYNNSFINKVVNVKLTTLLPSGNVDIIY